MHCVTTRIQKPFTLLVRVEHWLGQWLREALDERRDVEVMELLIAQKAVRRLMRELLQSELYGGPLDPEKVGWVRGFVLLTSVDTWLTSWLADARVRGSSESVELWAARGTIRSLLSELLEARKKSGGKHAMIA
jgi:hypothetical protein